MRLKIYLDTSVPNAYFDESKLERQRETKDFWNRLIGYEVFISQRVIEEINETPDAERRVRLRSLVEGFEILASENEEVENLALEYVAEGIIPLNHFDDAIHVATASVYKMDILVSWNYQHIVKLKTIRGVIAVNLLKGYNPLDIVDPVMVD